MSLLQSLQIDDLTLTNDCLVKSGREKDKTIQELKAALLELYSIWCIAEIELEDADYSRVEEIKAIANKG